MDTNKKNRATILLNKKETAVYHAAVQREENYIGARIAEGRREKKLSLYALSDMLAEHGVEITAAGINRWELGRSVPNAYQLLAVAYALGLEEDMSFFVDGKADLSARGREKLQEYKQDLIASGRYKPVTQSKQFDIRYVIKPVSYLTASAGTGALLDENQFENVRFPENAVPAGADFALYVSGDSMEPVYRDGQLVWVQRCETLRPGETGIFIYEGNGYIKAYGEQLPSADIADEFSDSYGNVRMQPVLISYNENYESIKVLPTSRFQVIGKVL